MASVQTSSISNVEYLPLDQIRRPIPPVLDEAKIKRMIDTLDKADKEHKSGVDDGLPPIDVLLVRKEGKNYYFGFGGCHRFQALERTNRKTVKCKVIPIPLNMLSTYLGSSVDEMFK